MSTYLLFFLTKKTSLHFRCLGKRLPTQVPSKREDKKWLKPSYFFLQTCLILRPCRFAAGKNMGVFSWDIQTQDSSHLEIHANKI